MTAAAGSLSLSALLAGFADAAALGALGASAKDIEIDGLELDSRRVRAGSLFLATAGLRSHGLDYAEQAVSRGAVAVAWEPSDGVSPPDLPVPTVAVPDLGRRAGEIAARFYGDPSADLFCVGITGTDGKTSSAYLLAQALTRVGERSGYMGTIGYGPVDALELASHTTPDPVRIQAWLARLRADRAVGMVMEVSSHALDQDRVAGVQFDIAALTNIGRDHLDYHGDLERYAAAKRRLFETAGLKLSIIKRDDTVGARWLGELPAEQCVSYGIDGESTTERYAIARSVTPTATGLEFELDTHAGAIAIRSTLLGGFNVYNLLIVAAVLQARGHALPKIADTLAWLGTVPGRMEGFHAPRGPLVVVDYAHTPQALVNVLAALRGHCRGTLTCVFGCGGDRDTGKRAFMGAAAEAGSDRLIITDDNPRSERPSDIVADILRGLDKPHAAQVLHDREAAIREAVATAGPDDVVLVAGKGHETEQIIGSERRPFSDRGLVADLVQQEASHAA